MAAEATYRVLTVVAVTRTATSASARPSARPAAQPTTASAAASARKRPSTAARETPSALSVPTSSRLAMTEIEQDPAAQEREWKVVRVAWTGISIYTWDVVFRAATVVGFFGAGGMGWYLRESVQRVASRDVAAILLSIIVVVILSELFSAWLRTRIAKAVA